MLPQYVTVTAAPVVVLMNNNNHVFNVSVRTAGGQTVEAALEDFQLASPLSPGPTWFALTASAIANLYVIQMPVRMLRITNAGVATILQQGIQ